VTLADGEFVAVPDNGPPGQPLPMSIDQEDFEAMARAESSPIAAAKGASRWRLTMTHYAVDPYEESEFMMDTEDDIFDWTWTGEFTVSEGQVAGSGQTVIGGNTLCQTDDPGWIHEDLNGSFDFTISGSALPGPNGTQFDLDIVGSPVEYAQAPDCSFYLEAVVPLYDTLSTDVEALTEPIVVAYPAGTASITFTAAAPPFWYGVPMEVTVEPAP
jgi:hypothetical protein